MHRTGGRIDGCKAKRPLSDKALRFNFKQLELVEINSNWTGDVASFQYAIRQKDDEPRSSLLIEAHLDDIANSDNVGFGNNIR
jgi:hypothetical protein